jgi:broad specificity phosphatase PhoE
MILLCTNGAHDFGVPGFHTPLSSTGARQAELLAQILQHAGTNVVYAAATRRSLDTVKAFIIHRKRTYQVCRVEATTDLIDMVATDDQRPTPMSMEEALSYGLNRQAFFGPSMIEELETFDVYRRRVIDWFTNHFFPRYEDAPNPTAIVADQTTLAILVYYILSRDNRKRVESIVSSLSHAGAVAQLEGDGMHMNFIRMLS